MTDFNDKPVLVSFFGGPGAGKHKAARILTDVFKDQGIDTELIESPPYDKEDLLENAYALPVLFGRQVEKLLTSESKIIITASPPWANAAYAEMYGNNEAFAIYARGMHASNYAREFSGVVDIRIDVGDDAPLVLCDKYKTRKKAVSIDSLLQEQHKLIHETRGFGAFSFLDLTVRQGCSGAYDSKGCVVLREILSFSSHR